MDGIQNGRTGYGDQIQAAKNKYAELRAEKDKLLLERNELNAKSRQAHDKKDKLVSSQRSLRSNLKFTTREEIDEEISRLRHQQETRSMTLMEEKRLIKEIEALQQSKDHAHKYSQERDTIERQNGLLKDFKAELTAKNKEIDGVQEKMNGSKEELDKLYALNAAEQQQGKYSELMNERKEIWAELDAKYQTIRELRDAFKEANDKYYENVRAIREKKRLARQEEEDRQKQEYEVKLAEYEKEVAKLHPFQNQLDICDALVTYFEKNFSKDLNNGETNSDDSNSNPLPELDGMKPLQRKTEDYMAPTRDDGRKKGKRGGGKKGKKDQKMSLPIVQLESLGTIGLLPPSKVSAVQATIDAIKEKKEWYQKQTLKDSDPTTSDEAAKITKTPSAESNVVSRKQNRREFKSSNERAFPTLGASAGDTGDSSSWGPSASVESPDAIASLSPTTEVVIADLEA